MAIIFDCFGVLAEDGWMPLKRKFVGDNKKLAQEIADLGKQNEYGLISNREHNEKVAKLMGIDVQSLRSALGKRVPNDELFKFIEKVLKPHYKIGLLTNANFDVLTDLFRPEQAKLFDASVMSYESKMIKPDQRMFELIAERLGLGTTECIYVDDQERYCAASEEFGMTSIGYKDLARFKTELGHLLSS